MALHLDTDNNTTTVQSSLTLSPPRKWTTNQLSVWVFGGNEQPFSGLSGLHGVSVWPISGPSGCTERVSVCRGPISSSVLPAGAGDWWWGAVATRQDRTVNPETLHTEAKGDTGESEDVYRAWLRSEMFWSGNCWFRVAAGWLLCRFPASG